MLIKNHLTDLQKQALPTLVRRFFTESKQRVSDDAVNRTIVNVVLGIQKKAAHDTWMFSDQIYCLCKPEMDIDGHYVYTAYQLWINPKYRNLQNVRQLIRFLRFYAQKQGYKRLYVLSSRLDKIKAYARGLGKKFKIETVTFVEEL